MIAFDGHADVRKFTVCTGLRRHSPKLIPVLGAPHGKQPRTHQAVKRETRRAADPFIQYHAHASARFGDDLRSPRVRGHKRGLSSSQRNVIVARGKHSPHAKRTCNPHRNLHGSYAVLDVTLIRREVGFFCVRQQRATHFFRMRYQFPACLFTAEGETELPPGMRRNCSGGIRLESDCATPSADLRSRRRFRNLPTRSSLLATSFSLEHRIKDTTRIEYNNGFEEYGCTFCYQETDTSGKPGRMVPEARVWSRTNGLQNRKLVWNGVVGDSRAAATRSQCEPLML